MSVVVAVLDAWNPGNGEKMSTETSIFTWIVHLNALFFEVKKCFCSSDGFPNFLQISSQSLNING